MSRDKATAFKTVKLEPQCMLQNETERETHACLIHQETIFSMYITLDLPLMFCTFKNKIFFDLQFQIGLSDVRKIRKREIRGKKERKEEKSFPYAS